MGSKREESYRWDELRDLAAALFEHDQLVGLEYDGPGVAAFYEGEARWAWTLGLTAAAVRRADATAPLISQRVSERGGGVG